MNINLPENAEKLIEIALKNKIDAYAVGGCVRDSLMGKVPKDFDIAINCAPEKTKEIYKDFKTFDTGIKFGTVSVKVDKDIFEVTTFRTDKDYLDKRHPEVTFTSDIREDLKRRDFTINAMAYNKKDGLIDFYGGQSDLKKNLIRCVGNPVERFDEDPLRILRALRFSANLDFEIEEETKKAIFAQYNLLSFVSAERKKIEIEKLLMGNAKNILKEYKDVIIECVNIENYENVIEYVEKAKSSDIKWAILLSESENIKTLVKDLKFSNELKKTCLFLHSVKKKKLKQDLISVKYLIKEFDVIGVKQIIEFKKALGENINQIEKNLKLIKEKNLCCTLKQLKISGKDLIENGFKEKEKYSKILDSLLNLVIEEKCENEKQKLLKEL